MSKFLIPLFPAPVGSKCEGNVGLNQAGKPVECCGKGFIKVHDQDGPVLCSEHFNKAKPDLENVATNLIDLSLEDREERRKESRQKRRTK